MLLSLLAVDEDKLMSSSLSFLFRSDSTYSVKGFELKSLNSQPCLVSRSRKGRFVELRIIFGAFLEELVLVVDVVVVVVNIATLWVEMV